LISQRQIIHFSFRLEAKQAKEWSKGKSFEHYVTSISQTLVSITSLLSHSRLFLAMIELHVSSEDLSINHQVEKEGKVCVNPQVNNIAIACHHHLFALSESEAQSEMKSLMEKSP
jgi:hypothetical protein